ncbi:MAG: hypothetical protein V4525_01155 [Pseudomonadota bacterium]
MRFIRKLTLLSTRLATTYSPAKAWQLLILILPGGIIIYLIMLWVARHSAHKEEQAKQLPIK